MGKVLFYFYSSSFPLYSHRELAIINKFVSMRREIDSSKNKKLNLFIRNGGQTSLGLQLF